MTVQQDVETVLSELQRGYHDYGHHPNCSTRDDDGCDCYARQSAPARAALARLAVLAEQAEMLTNERDMLQMSHDEGNEILGEIVCQIETVSPDDPDASCKCGPCRHHRGVTRLCLLAAQTEREQAARERFDSDPCPGCDVCELAIELIEEREQAERLGDALTKCPPDCLANLGASFTAKGEQQ